MKRIWAGTLALALLAPAHHAVRAQGASAPQFPQLPLKRDQLNDDVFPTSASWIAVLALLAAGGAWFVAARRRSRSAAGAAGDTLKTLRTTALTQQATLHVIEWHGEELLIGCTPGSMTLLAHHPSATTGTAAKGAS